MIMSVRGENPRLLSCISSAEQLASCERARRSPDQRHGRRVSCQLILLFPMQEQAEYLLFPHLPYNRDRLIREESGFLMRWFKEEP